MRITVLTKSRRLWHAWWVCHNKLGVLEWKTIWLCQVTNSGMKKHMLRSECRVFRSHYRS